MPDPLTDAGLRQRAEQEFTRVQEACDASLIPSLDGLREALDAYFAAVDQIQPGEAQLRAALEESVKLQSHYAGLLNMHDGGRRIQFANADAWLKRLATLTQPDAASPEVKS